jgi:hypothetical protein
MACRHTPVARAETHSGRDIPGESPMKHTELLAFLKDLTLLIQEKYNTTLGACREGEEESAYQFRNGQNFAYYDVLDLMHSQLLVLGIPTRELEPVVPELGQALLRS